jgi:hypothetical protein
MNFITNIFQILQSKPHNSILTNFNDSQTTINKIRIVPITENCECRDRRTNERKATLNRFPLKTA